MENVQSSARAMQLASPEFQAAHDAEVSKLALTLHKGLVTLAQTLWSDLPEKEQVLLMANTVDAFIALSVAYMAEDGGEETVLADVMDAARANLPAAIKAVARMTARAVGNA